MGILSFLNPNDSKKINLTQEAKDFIDVLNTTKSLEPISVDVLLDKNEDAYFIEQDIDYGEERNVRISKGRGVSFRVIRGVYYHTGGSQGRYLPEIERVDKGNLYLTNKRAIFKGRFETRTFDLNKIISIENFSDAIVLSGVTKKTPYFFVYNPYLWKVRFMILSQVDNLKKLPHLSFEFA